MELELKKKHKNIIDNGILKNFDSDEEKDQQDEEQDDLKNEQKEMDIYTHNTDVLFNVRLEMIKYCDDMYLPLCDYLTHDNMTYFIDFLFNDTYYL